MLSNYIKYIIVLFVIAELLIPQKFSSIQNKLTKEQQQIIAQASALENSGLLDEAIIAYQDIITKFPTLQIVFDKLKKIYINKRELDELLKISEQYIKSSNYSINSKINVLDVYIITDNEEWRNIVQILYNKPINLVHIKKTLLILFKYNKSSAASDLIEYIRTETKHKGFYALELGNFFTLELDFNSAINEYLIYLSEKPKNIQFITQRIMSLADYNIAIEPIKNKLSSNSSTYCTLSLQVQGFDW